MPREHHNTGEMQLMSDGTKQVLYLHGLADAELALVPND